jgi:ATP/maltotriose-dependent transcriptional regulator MalT
MSVVAIVLVFLTAKLISKNKRYIIANHKINIINNELDSTLMQLKATNESLKEYNKIKDEYIGRFMEVCSMIIENAVQKHKTINKLAREKKMAELYSEIKNEDFITENTKLFYYNFDEAFLNLFPDFDVKINKLLKPDFQFVIKDKVLTTELRILALLRLGFSDNKQIASILRSSITTIYTYRSKIRSKALDKDGFEEYVKTL